MGSSAMASAWFRGSGRGEEEAGEESSGVAARALPRDGARGTHEFVGPTSTGEGESGSLSASALAALTNIAGASNPLRLLRRELMGRAEGVSPGVRGKAMGRMGDSGMGPSGVCTRGGVAGSRLAGLATGTDTGRGTVECEASGAVARTGAMEASGSLSRGRVHGDALGGE